MLTYMPQHRRVARELQTRRKNIAEQRRACRQAGTQFTCFTSTKVLALLVQKVPAQTLQSSGAPADKQVRSLLALLVPKYLLY
jgi:hypothetical protein